MPPKKLKTDGEESASSQMLMTTGDDASDSDASVGSRKQPVKRTPSVRIKRPATFVAPVPVAVVDPVDELKATTGQLHKNLMEEVGRGQVPAAVASMTLDAMNNIEKLLIKVIRESERLKGENEVLRQRPAVPAAPAVAASVGVVPPVAAPRLRKPVETWSAVVRSKDEATTEEVMKKVLKEVAPSLGVRVHEIRPIKNGGAVIRTPSVAEREKVVKNAAFKEAGLEVVANKPKGVKVAIHKVERDVATEQFMKELHSVNFEKTCSFEEFKKEVRLVSKPWTVSAGNETLTVIIEGPAKLMSQMLDIGIAYVLHHNYRVREMDLIACCFRCYGTDHRVKDCRRKSDVCRQCGQMGHRAGQCSNQLNCRDCALRGLPSG